MADFQLKYTGEEVNETIKDAKKIREMYETLQSHLQGHVTNDARGILIADSGTLFGANNVEDVLVQMEKQYNQYIKNANQSFEDLTNQLVLTSEEIDTIITNALK